MPAADPPPQAEAAFTSLWPVYAKAVEHDYFHHRAVGRVLHRVLAEEVGRPFRFLDLACGDARTTTAALLGTPVAHYRGVDLSEVALAAARQTVAGLPCPAELTQADFTAVVAGLAGAADVAWVGLSAHHLRTPDKATFLRQVRQVVGRYGWLLLYEPVCRDGEERSAYLDRFEQVYRPLWTALTAAEWASVMTHVRASDYPESAAGWAELGRAGGFADVRELFTDPAGMLGLICYRP